MILYSSDKQKAKKMMLLYLAVTVFCGVFGSVYEYFGHGVFSPYMMYLFLFPLAGGMLVQLLFMVTKLPYPVPAASRLYHAGLASLTVGSCMTGVFEIYGSASSLTKYYWYAGFVLIAAAAVYYVVFLIKRESIQ